MVNLILAKCCGSCKHVNRPNQPKGHAPYYTVAKTERWCYKYGIPTMREAVCKGGWEPQAGRSAATSNMARIRRQNERLQRILEISNWMKANNIKSIPLYDEYFEKDRPRGEFILLDGKLMYKSLRYPLNKPSYLDVKTDRDLNKLEKAYRQFITKI